MSHPSLYPLSPHLTTSDDKLAVISGNLRRHLQSPEWEIRIVCPIRASICCRHISPLLTTN
ncbi:MAG: hypothetical protein II288_02265, partial [Alistipes sp.]|nr:hypothetical protein [Alistipes sp.]